jgi:hypothetical protein
LERSSLPDNKFFSPNAISHQDFVAEFSDTNIFIPGTPIQIPNHDPLGIAVHLESYAWNFPFADAFVIMNYTIKNVGYNNKQDTLKNVYVGLWGDLTIRNINILQPRVGAPFYQDVGVGYINDPDSGQMVYAYEHDGGPASNYTNANSYVSMNLLGAETTAGDNLYKGDITYNWWFFSGGNEDWQQAPNSESARYERMRQSISQKDYLGNVRRQGGNFMSLMSTGPFEQILPGEEINVVFAIVCGKKFSNLPPSVDNAITKQLLLENVSWARRAYFGEDSNRNGMLDYVGTDSTEDVIPNGKLDRYILPTPPEPPRIKVIPTNNKVTLLWDNTSEISTDFISKERDFEGYRVYRSFIGNDIDNIGILENMQLIKEYDLKNKLYYDSGLDAIKLDSPITEIVENANTGLPDTIVYIYKFEVENLHNGWQYAFSVTAFDSGDVGLNLPSLESSRLANVNIVSPGSPAREAGSKLKVGVYPNPYKASALWDGTFERQRKLFFYNLPAQSEVRIYTLSGELVDKFDHQSESYNGTDIEWYQKFSNGNTVFPGGEHAWDLVSRNDQALATGLYLFTVKDLETSKIYRGKFVIIK